METIEAYEEKQTNKKKEVYKEQKKNVSIPQPRANHW